MYSVQHPKVNMLVGEEADRKFPDKRENVLEDPGRGQTGVKAR